MSSYFLDTSALLKRYALEMGSAWIRQLVAKSRRQNIVIAQITQVELISGIMRRKRDGTIPTNIANGIRMLIDKHLHQEYHVVGLTQDIIYLAEDLLDKYPLRSFDAIQLASALYTYRSVGYNYSFTFVSSDNRLLAFANSEGLTTDNPNNHP